MFLGRQKQRALWVLTRVSATSESCCHAPTAPCGSLTWLCQESPPPEVRKGQRADLEGSPHMLLEFSLVCVTQCTIFKQGRPVLPRNRVCGFSLEKKINIPLPQYFLTWLQPVAGFLYLPERQSARGGFQLQGGSSELFWIPLAPHIPPAALFF